ncbi:preprotein translocase subunit SecY, partial [Patescibacteria group bacterium]|nr:preprotein translocase subunit SecY [Patescibacteria group bacterium]
NAEILFFPSMTANFFINSKIQWLAHLATFMSGLVQNQLLYGIVYFILVILFTFFYTAVTFDPHAIAENLQAQGGFIPGIRPGANTVKYLEYILYRIVLVGALFLGVIAVIPVIMQGVTGNTNFTIGGTAILIVVAVVLETYKQIKAQVIMRDYAL